MTSHPSLSTNLPKADCPRFPLSGISRWRADQVETKRVLRQLVRMEYVPRKCGSACQETVAFIVSDVGGGAGSGERAMDSARLREIYMGAHRRVQAGARGRGVEESTVDQVNRGPGSWVAIARAGESASDPRVHPRSMLGTRSMTAASLSVRRRCGAW